MAGERDADKAYEKRDIAYFADVPAATFGMFCSSMHFFSETSGCC
jgi:hypothetical protein